MLCYRLALWIARASSVDLGREKAAFGRLAQAVACNELPHRAYDKIELAAGAEQREAGASERVRLRVSKKEQQLQDRVLLICSNSRRRLLHRTRAMRRRLARHSSASPKTVPSPPLMWFTPRKCSACEPAAQLQNRYQVYVVSGQSAPGVERYWGKGKKKFRTLSGRVPSTRVLTFQLFRQLRAH